MRVSFFLPFDPEQLALREKPLLKGLRVCFSIQTKQWMLLDSLMV
jgi:hypothetical protein